MKAFKVVYQHGHFIDSETEQRLIPVQGAEYTITADDRAFKKEDSKLITASPRNPKEKEQWALKEFGEGNYGKILNSGTQLFFRIGNSKRVEGDESRQYIFVCTILEDLYLYKIKSRKGNELEDWRLADCICVLDKCLKGGLTLSEKIPALSLSMLFGYTVMFYFSLQRSGSANAFKTFFLYKPGMDISFHGAIHELYEGLGTIRKDFVAKRNKASSGK